MIAGFNAIEGGEFSFDENIIMDIPTHKGNIGIVFQYYALFPHLTVRQNAEYGLKIRKEDKKIMKKKWMRYLMSSRSRNTMTECLKTFLMDSSKESHLQEHSYPS